MTWKQILTVNKNLKKIIAEVFLQRQKVITSKSLSKNLSNVNKLGNLTHFLSRKQQKLRFFDVFFDVIIVD